ncbi:hypothetical protein H632_c576p1 [Helicosporidium sp. ATCC 50920]|nr:hypothetical protein H632_c576p1 [Helicosporidium sp. ATCC 50920]|eukprot:KDD75640.1 hypothetical protein H632_c576p1 [Helicosporidium sp. ATCC 50920]
MGPDPACLDAIKLQLEKKATFCAGAEALELAIRRHIQCKAHEPSEVKSGTIEESFPAELKKVVARLATLLQSRHTMLPAWQAALPVFRATDWAMQGSADAAFKAKLAEWIAATLAFLESHEDDAERAGQLGDGVEPETAPPLALDGPLSMLEALVQLGAAGFEEPAAAADESPATSARRNGDLAEALRMAQERAEEMEGLLSETPVQPPASRAFVRTLPRTIQTADTLRALGGKDACCAICIGELGEDAVTLTLPCSHTYHARCVEPWLESKNSCPSCRAELPTDSQAYERHKQSVLDAARAATAVGHDEFMYR